MNRGFRILAIVVVSLASGAVIWLALAWTLSFIADRSSSTAAEFALAAISPLAFGPLVAIVAAALIFFLLKRHA